MNKKIIVGASAGGFGIVGVILIALGAHHTVSTHRNPASDSGDTVNMKALKSIPLMKDVEQPESDEGEITDQLVDIFDRFADRNANSDGSLNRGTHAKGKCFRGNFTIFSGQELKDRFHHPDALVSRLKQGFFATDGTFPAHLRFANADGLGRKQADTEADVRGFSFSIETPNVKDFLGTGRQDFMMNSTAAFATGGIHDFLELVKAANILVYQDLTYFPNLGRIGSVIEAFAKLNKGNSSGGGTKSFATTEFWANLPYSHGLDATDHPAEIVKFKATPCDGQGTQHLSSVEGLDANYLQKDIVDRANSHNVCFYFQVQFFDGDKLRSIATENDQKQWKTSDWVENGGLLWDETALPFYTVAKIETASDASPEVSCDTQYINTRLHSSRANLPMGSIARVRTIVEEASRARRMNDTH